MIKSGISAYQYLILITCYSALMVLEVLQPGEKIIVQSSGGYLKNKLNLKTGKIILTDKRFIFLKHTKEWLKIFGLIGLLLSRRTKLKEVFSFNIADIQDAERTRYGINNKILLLKTLGGEFKFIVDSDIEMFVKLLHHEFRGQNNHVTNPPTKI